MNVVFDKVLGSGGLVPSGFSTQCILVVDPLDYAEPTSGYPIVAVSYLLGNSAANGLDVGQVRGVLFSPYNALVTSQVFYIGPNTGLSFLTINGATPAQIQTKINGCIN